MSILTAEPRLQPLGPVAIGVVVFAACHLTHANPYIAAFAAGSVLATLDHVVAERFEPFGELLAELTKFAALLLFGALITPERFSHLGWADWLLAIVAIVLVRRAAILLSLWRTRLPRSERLTAAWFGPKRFASVVYVLLGRHTISSIGALGFRIGELSNPKPATPGNTEVDLTSFAALTTQVDAPAMSDMFNHAITTGPVSLPEAVAMLDTAYLGHVIVLWSWALKQPNADTTDSATVRFRSLDGRDREIAVPV